MKVSLLLTLCGMILASALAISECHAKEILPPAKTNRISVNYVFPTKPEHQEIYKELKQRQSLENLQAFLSPFRLRWALVISLEECDGEADASYWEGQITICYEYIEELRQFMPAETTAGGIEPIDTLLGPFFDTLLHEFAHALFDDIYPPILGREEDAADQVSAYIYLQLGKDEARRLITGTIYTYMMEVQDTDAPTLEEYADEHGTSEQRAFNLMCIAYGADPELFKDVLTLGGLPKARAEICAEEYEQIAHAYEKLIAPHIDHDLAKKVFDRSWLPSKTTLFLQKQRVQKTK